MDNDSTQKEINQLRERINKLRVIGEPSLEDRKLYAQQPKMLNLWEWLSADYNKPGINVLEIGSREVANKSRLKQALPLANHIGLDIHPGPNVDITGDAHDLSKFIKPNSIDVIISFAVFEHLAMPWIVAEEYAKCLKIGGVAGTFTHLSFSEHELPWHFFQFNSFGLEVLFNSSLGFELIESGKGMPIVGRFAHDNKPEHRGKPVKNLYCSSYILAKKVSEISPKFSWKSALPDALKQTEYPRNTGMHRKY